jgi:hypothetical protein
MPTIDLTDDEYAALTAAIRHAPRLDPLRAALAKFDAGAEANPEAPLPKTPPGAPGAKRARR